MARLDPWSETPFYRQLAGILRQQIKELEPGTKLPTEHELAEQHHVSRDTVRKALRILREEGLIRVFKGRGTFVPPK